MEEGLFSKYAANGQYKIDMKWFPPGEILPDTDYSFEFHVRDALTDTPARDSSFDLEIIQNGRIIDTREKESDSSLFSQTLSFGGSGIVSFVLSDINDSGQDIKFSMKLDAEDPDGDSGFTPVRKVDGKPVIFACGFEKNAVTLQKCYATKTYDGYGWFGKVNFLIYAPGWNENPHQVERIGHTEENKLTLSSRSDSHPYQELGICDGFVETGADTGLFVGRVKLSGHDHDVNGDGKIEKRFGSTKCSNSPIDEYAKIEAGREGAVTLTWQYQNDPVRAVSKSISFNWNLGELEFSQDLYHVDDRVEFTFKDRDMYKVGEKEHNLSFTAYSDSDRAGVLVRVGENYKFKEPFDFTMNTQATIGTSLRVSNGDTIYVQYDDCTVPRGVDHTGLAYPDDHCVKVVERAIVYTY